MTKPNGWTGGEWRLFHSDDGHAWIADKNLENVCWVRIEENAGLIAAAPSLYEALAELLSKVEREECHHESTHRGGTIWTFCDECGQKWADDEGGFVPYVEPAHIAKARAALSAAEGGV